MSRRKNQKKKSEEKIRMKKSEKIRKYEGFVKTSCEDRDKEISERDWDDPRQDSHAPPSIKGVFTPSCKHPKFPLLDGPISCQS
jgi:hypothetical protein